MFKKRLTRVLIVVGMVSMLMMLLAASVAPAMAGGKANGSGGTDKEKGGPNTFWG